jgi:hypothetical protein
MPTIVPITSEDNWLSSLHHLSSWVPPSVPTIVLAPHPDDETLGAGGLIAKLCRQGAAVTVVAITDGENAYADTNLGTIRVPEQMEALSRLGVPESMVHRFQLPDRDVSACEDQLVDLLLALVEPGMHVVAPLVCPACFVPVTKRDTGMRRARWHEESGTNPSRW